MLLKMEMLTHLSIIWKYQYFLRVFERPQESKLHRSFEQKLLFSKFSKGKYF